MLFLLFHVENNVYALETSHVVEVIPIVILRKVYLAPDYMAGLFNYRGVIIPVIDFSYLLKGTPSRFYLSTRIIILNYPNKDNTARYLGLIAEQVTETLNKPDSELVDLGINVPDASYLSQMMIDEKGLIQCIKLEQLLANSQQLFLLSEAIP